VKRFALVAAAMLLAPAAARANTETVTHGAVTANLTLAPPSLQIVRAGTAAFDAPVTDICPCAFSGSDDVQVVDIDGDGEDEVVVYSASVDGLQTGIYRYDGSTYQELATDWGAPGMQLVDEDGDGDFELVTGDARFEEKFSPPFPPASVFSLENGALVDETVAYPSVAMDNAADALRAIRRLHRHDRLAAGPVAAYVADQYLLGRPSAGTRLLGRLVDRGIVTAAYRKRLLHVLIRLGYR
jgi:hypothetical protein